MNKEDCCTYIINHKREYDIFVEQLKRCFQSNLFKIECVISLYTTITAVNRKWTVHEALFA